MLRKSSTSLRLIVGWIQVTPAQSAMRLRRCDKTRFEAAFSVPALLHEKCHPAGAIVDSQIEVQEGPFEFWFGRRLDRGCGIPVLDVGPIIELRVDGLYQACATIRI